MRLISNEPLTPIHLSHFMNLVSAYEPSSNMIENLFNDLQHAIEKAKSHCESKIVSQDTNEFFFLVHPSGSIDLCARMRSFVLEVKV